MTRRVGRRAAPWLFLALAPLAACRAGTSRPAGILLITLDTTRADHLGCYGNSSAATPNLDALANEGVRFEQAMTPVPTTLPSHATMFTGLYPPRHGVRYNGMFKLADASVTVAERLHGAGFSTGAVVSAYPVFKGSGLAQGFDTYRDMFSEPGSDRLAPGAERAAPEVVKLGLEEIRGAGGKPFFVWLHFYEAHYPYKPPFPYSTTFRDHPYDGEIAFVDRQLGDLFAALKSDGLWDKVAIVVAGDHGEGLYEHGERMHAQLAYQSTLRVPLLIKAPGVDKGAVVREPVTLADVAPTILDLAGLPVPEGLDGISLRPALRGDRPPTRNLYFETLAGALAFGWSPIEGVRRGPWKLIRAGTMELYDLESDPRELTDRMKNEPSRAADLATTLEQDLARWAADPSATASAQAAPIDAEKFSQLIALGYAGGTTTTAQRGGPNPKDLAHLESELLLIQDLFAQHKYDRAMLAAPEILREDPGNRLVLQGAAEAAAVLRDFPRAEGYAREAIRRYPEALPAVVTLGRIQVAKHDFAAAEKVFRDGLERFHDEPILVYSLALSLVADKRAAEAEPIVQQALGRPNPDPAFHVLRALCRAIAKDDATAKTELETAMANGYANMTTLRSEPLLAPLRAIPGFAEAIAPKKKQG